MPESAANIARGNTSEKSGVMTSAAENTAARTIHRTDHARSRMFFQSACSTDCLFQTLDLGAQPVVNLDFFGLLALDAVQPYRELLHNVHLHF